LWQFYVASNLYVRLSSVVFIATTLHVVRAGVRIPIGVKKILLFSKSPAGDWGPCSPLLNEEYGPLPGVKLPAREVPIFRMFVAILPDPLYDFMLWTGKISLQARGSVHRNSM